MGGVVTKADHAQPPITGPFQAVTQDTCVTGVGVAQQASMLPEVRQNAQHSASFELINQANDPAHRITPAASTSGLSAAMAAMEISEQRQEAIGASAAAPDRLEFASTRSSHSPIAKHANSDPHNDPGVGRQQTHQATTSTPLVAATASEDFAAADSKDDLSQTRRSSHAKSLIHWSNLVCTGSGRNSAVAIVTDQCSGEEFAMKKVRHDVASEENPKPVSQEDYFVRRIGPHPNILPFVKSFASARHTYLLFELRPCGDLFNFVRTHGALTERAAAIVAYQIATALQHVHECGIVHRDVKPENVLVVRIRNRKLPVQHRRRRGDNSSPVVDAHIMVELADFGSAQTLDTHAADAADSANAGGLTWAYAPPEAVQGDLTPRTSGDTWGFGVLLFILLSGFHPFDEHGMVDIPQIKSKIVAGRWSFEHAECSAISTQARDLISSCLEPHPELRPTMREILQDPWFPQTINGQRHVGQSSAKSVKARK